MEGEYLARCQGASTLPSISIHSKTWGVTSIWISICVSCQVINDIARFILGYTLCYNNFFMGVICKGYMSRVAAKRLSVLG